jgi:hypothetical protein
MSYLPPMRGSSPSQGAVHRVNRHSVSRQAILARIGWGTAVLLAAGGALGLTAGTAAAGQAPTTLQYSCQLPLLGAQSLTATFAWPSGLQKPTVDTRTPRLPVQVAATVASAARILVSLDGIESIEGTADVSTEIIAPQGDISENVKLSVPFTDVSTGIGPLTVPASGLLPSVVLSQPGQATVIVGAVVIQLATLTPSGAPSILRNISIPCTLNPGQTGIVSSLQILPIVLPAARPSSAAQAAPTRTAASTQPPSPTRAATPIPAPALTPAPVRSLTNAHTQTPAPSSGLNPQGASVKLLRRAAPLARSFPGLLLLVLFLLFAAIVAMLKAALKAFNIGSADAVRKPSAKR